MISSGISSLTSHFTARILRQQENDDKTQNMQTNNSKKSKQIIYKNLSNNNCSKESNVQHDNLSFSCSHQHSKLESLVVKFFFISMLTFFTIKLYSLVKDLDGEFIMLISKLKELKIEEFSTQKFMNFTDQDIYIVANNCLFYLPKKDIEFKYIEIKRKETFYSSDNKEISIEIVKKVCELDHICKDEDYSIWNKFILQDKEKALALKSAIDVDCYYIGDTVEVDNKLYVLNLCTINEIF